MASTNSCIDEVTGEGYLLSGTAMDKQEYSSLQMKLLGVDMKLNLGVDINLKMKPADDGGMVEYTFKTRIDALLGVDMELKMKPSADDGGMVVKVKCEPMASTNIWTVEFIDKVTGEGYLLSGTAMDKQEYLSLKMKLLGQEYTFETRLAPLGVDMKLNLGVDMNLKMKPADDGGMVEYTFKTRFDAPLGVDMELKMKPSADDGGMVVKVKCERSSKQTAEAPQVEPWKVEDEIAETHEKIIAESTEMQGTANFKVKLD